MLLYKAKTGDLINPSNVNMVNKPYRSENYWVVRFDFGHSSREFLFDRERDAIGEIERFEAHCANNQ